jgi:zinc transport system substrate-binding protein
MKLCRQIAAAGLAALLALACCTGCGGARKSDRFEIVTTVYAVYDMAKQLTAEFDRPVEVRLLLTPGGESHSYEPSPADAAAIQRCGLFAYIGGSSEQWADKMIAASRTDKDNLRLFDSVQALAEETVEGMEAEEPDFAHDHDHDGIEPDEHIWTSPRNADAMLSALHGAVNKAVPTEAAHCNEAYERLHAAFQELDSRALEIVQNQKRDTIIVADRFPFRYLTHDYGWNYYAAFAGCSSDTDASAATLSFLIKKVQELHIGTVFYLENSTQKISDAVCQATGAKAVMLQSGNNVSAADFNAGKHYQDIMAENLNAIEGALS